MADVPIRPAATLFVARAVYAFNWYNVGAVLALIGVSLQVGAATLGLVLGAFLVGVGIFQIPAGIAAARYGARSVSLFGLLLMGTACLFSAFYPSIDWLIGTRFIAGVGAAFFFSPGLSLIASYYPEGRRGPIIGLYNGGFSLGGAIGLVGGLAVGTTFGWAAALGVGGAALMGMGIVALFLLPNDRPVPRARPSVRALLASSRPVLTSRSIWALSIALTGFWGAVYIVAQYFVLYTNADHPGWAAWAGIIVALFVVMSLPGGPVGGWLAERRADRRWVIGLAAIAASSIVLSIAWASFASIWAVMIALGFVDGIIFAVLYLIPSYLPESRGTNLALGVALVNSIQVGLGAILAIAFGFIAEFAGYDWAWGFAAAASFALLPLLFLVRAGRSAPTPRESGASPSGGSAAGAP